MNFMDMDTFQIASLNDNTCTSINSIFDKYYINGINGIMSSDIINNIRVIYNLNDDVNDEKEIEYYFISILLICFLNNELMLDEGLLVCSLYNNTPADLQHTMVNQFLEFLRIYKNNDNITLDRNNPIKQILIQIPIVINLKNNLDKHIHHTLNTLNPSVYIAERAIQTKKDIKKEIKNQITRNLNILRYGNHPRIFFTDYFRVYFINVDKLTNLINHHIVIASSKFLGLPSQRTSQQGRSPQERIIPFLQGRDIFGSSREGRSGDSATYRAIPPLPPQPSSSSLLQRPLVGNRSPSPLQTEPESTESAESAESAESDKSYEINVRDNEIIQNYLAVEGGNNNEDSSQDIEVLLTSLLEQNKAVKFDEIRDDTNSLFHSIVLYLNMGNGIYHNKYIKKLREKVYGKLKEYYDLLLKSNNKTNDDKKIFKTIFDINDYNTFWNNVYKLTSNTRLKYSTDIKPDIVLLQKYMDSIKDETYEGDNEIIQILCSIIKKNINVYKLVDERNIIKKGYKYPNKEKIETIETIEIIYIDISLYNKQYFLFVFKKNDQKIKNIQEYYSNSNYKQSLSGFVDELLNIKEKLDEDTKIVKAKIIKSINDAPGALFVVPSVLVDIGQKYTDEIKDIYDYNDDNKVENPEVNQVVKIQIESENKWIIKYLKITKISIIDNEKYNIEGNELFSIENKFLKKTGTLGMLLDETPLKEGDDAVFLLSKEGGISNQLLSLNIQFANAVTEEIDSEDTGGVIPMITSSPERNPYDRTTVNPLRTPTLGSANRGVETTPVSIMSTITGSVQTNRSLVVNKYKESENDFKTVLDKSNDNDMKFLDEVMTEDSISDDLFEELSKLIDNVDKINEYDNYIGSNEINDISRSIHRKSSKAKAKKTTIPTQEGEGEDEGEDEDEGEGEGEYEVENDKVNAELSMMRNELSMMRDLMNQDYNMTDPAYAHLDRLVVDEQNYNITDMYFNVNNIWEYTLTPDSDYNIFSDPLILDEDEISTIFNSYNKKPEDVMTIEESEEKDVVELAAEPDTEPDTEPAAEPDTEPQPVRRSSRTKKPRERDISTEPLDTQIQVLNQQVKTARAKNNVLLMKKLNVEVNRKYLSEKESSNIINNYTRSHVITAITPYISPSETRKVRKRASDITADDNSFRTEAREQLSLMPSIISKHGDDFDTYQLSKLTTKERMDKVLSSLLRIDIAKIDNPQIRKEVNNKINEIIEKSIYIDSDRNKSSDKEKIIMNEELIQTANVFISDKLYNLREISFPSSEAQQFSDAWGTRLMTLITTQGENDEYFKCYQCCQGFKSDVGNTKVEMEHKIPCVTFAADVPNIWYFSLEMAYYRVFLQHDIVLENQDINDLLPGNIGDNYIEYMYRFINCILVTDEIYDTWSIHCDYLLNKWITMFQVYMLKSIIDEIKTGNNKKAKEKLMAWSRKERNTVKNIVPELDDLSTVVLTNTGLQIKHQLFKRCLKCCLLEYAYSHEVCNRIKTGADLNNPGELDCYLQACYYAVNEVNEVKKSKKSKGNPTYIVRD